MMPLTETITIGAGSTPGSLAAHTLNGARKVLLAVRLHGKDPQLHRDGAAMREVLPDAAPRDVLDLLAAGVTGEHAIVVRRSPFPARRDVDFEAA